ncbi:HET-domain-containing protein, partial [Lepidopterella palustris CBS 459.81]
YQPLQLDEIRLIELQRRVDDSKNIICSLITVRLQDAPAYTALSYVWGSEEDAAIVQIDGVDFRVTQNLKDALLHLQMPDQERLMWVDALVINQSDIPERNEQVPRMRDIYASAKSVVIWLGKGNSNLETLLGLIAEVPGIIPDDPA